MGSENAIQKALAELKAIELEAQQQQPIKKSRFQRSWREQVALQNRLPLSLLPDIESMNTVEEMRKAATERQIEQIRPLAKSAGVEQRLNQILHEINPEVMQKAKSDDKSKLLAQIERVRLIARNAGREFQLDQILKAVDPEGVEQVRRFRERDQAESVRGIARQAGTAWKLEKVLEEF